MKQNIIQKCINFSLSYLLFAYMPDVMFLLTITEKKYCYKKRGSYVYRKSIDVVFYLTSPRVLYYSTVHSDNGLYIVLSVEKYH